jgi:hypothetical protein
LNDASTAAFPPAMSDCPEVIAKVTSELAAIANDVGLGAPHEEAPLAIVQLIALTPLTHNATTVAATSSSGTASSHENATNDCFWPNSAVRNENPQRDRSSKLIPCCGTSWTEEYAVHVTLARAVGMRSALLGR